MVTLAMMDQVHGRPEGTARRTFNANKERLVEGRHFFKKSADEIRTRFPGLIAERATEDVTLLTERGYLVLVKSFTDDLAWKTLISCLHASLQDQSARPSRCCLGQCCSTGPAD